MPHISVSQKGRKVLMSLFLCSQYGQTPLVLALDHRQTHVVKALLDGGAHVGDKSMVNIIFVQQFLLPP